MQQVMLAPLPSLLLLLRPRYETLDYRIAIYPLFDLAMPRFALRRVLMSTMHSGVIGTVHDLHEHETRPLELQCACACAVLR